MPANGSIWTFAGLTAAVGMGVVFVALFLLSMYMHYFKVLIARFEGGRKAAPAPPKAAARAPAVKSAAAAPTAARDDGGAVAAAIAVGLQLAGLRGAPSGEVAAAIAFALAAHRERSAGAAATRAGPTPGWRLAGRMDAMSGRARRHERPPRG